MSRDVVSRLSAGFRGWHFLVLYVLAVSFKPLWVPDESRYAEISREMVASGNWVVPHFLGLRYFEKPAGGYWFNNIFHWLFGESHLSVRLGVVVSTLLAAWLVWRLAHHMFDSRQKAWWAVVGYLTSFLVIGLGTYATLDPMLTLALVSAMCCYWLAISTDAPREKLLWHSLFGASCGMAFLVKGFVGLAIPVVALVPFMLMQRRFRELVLFGLLAIACAIVVAAPWAIAIHLAEPDYWQYFFWVENVHRFAAEDAQHVRPFWFYLPIFLIAALPWLGVLPRALRTVMKVDAGKTAHWYLVAWIAMPTLMLSIAHGKLPTYILPCLAPLALLVASGFSDSNEAEQARALRANAWINTLLPLLLITAVVYLQLGHGRHEPPYSAAETTRLSIFLGGLAVWLAAGLAGIRWPRRSVHWTGIALAGFFLWNPLVLPASMVDSKLPDNFLREHADVLSQAGIVGSNDVGAAAAMAWVLRREDIVMLGSAGELEYGLSFDDARERFVSTQEIASWVLRKRRNGSVALFFRTGLPGADASLPVPDKLIRSERFELRIYELRP